SVTTTSSVKGKGLVNAFEVGTDETKIGTRSTTMGLGEGKYTDFSPENIFIGLNSGVNTQVSPPFYGIDNVFLGNNSGTSNTLGKANIFIGSEAGNANEEGNWNIFIGHNAGLMNQNGDRNVFIGYESGQANTIGTANTFVGEASGTRNIDGFGNSFFGRNAGAENNYGDYNTGIGYEAGGLNTTGNYNSCFGAEAGYYNQTGSSNSIFGYQAGKGVWGTSNSNNCFFGYQSGFSVTSGTGNVFLGFQAGYNETLSNKLYIANSNTATPLIKGTFPNTDLTFTTSRVSIIHPVGTSNGLYFQNTYNGNTDAWNIYQYTSDELALLFNGVKKGSFDITSGVYTSVSDMKFKKNIEEFADVLDKVMLLQPKRYNFTSQKSDEPKYIGLIAQDVKELFPSFVHYSEEDDSYTMDYAGLSVVAIQAIKEQQEKINLLENTCDTLQQQINDLREMMKR
ncbi:MAG: tail fiber domain-containing protein, partial [Candidatus Delongbacteria bacterium]